MTIDLRDFLITGGSLLALICLFQMGALPFGTACGVLLVLIGLFAPGRRPKKKDERDT